MRPGGKKIMILGAGPFQVPGIIKAVRLGLEVVTVDYLPDNLGHRHSHHFVNCDTRDSQGVLQAARRLAVDGICTFSSDVACATVSQVAQGLGLPGPPLASVQAMTNKAAFRRFQRQHGLPCPHFAVLSSHEQLPEGVAGLNPPLLFKPPDSSGSRGVTSCDELRPEALRAAYESAAAFSSTGEVVAEEMVAGQEVGGDGFMAHGRLRFMAVTHKHLRGFLVKGHSLPPSLPADDLRRVRQTLQECLGLLGYSDGAVNFDVMVNQGQVVILEMSPRTGGNGIGALIERYYDVDLERAVIEAAMGGEPRLASSSAPGPPCASLVFGAEQGGTLRGLAVLDALRGRVAGVYDLRQVVETGQEVQPLEHNGNLVGYVLFECPDHDSFAAMAEVIEDALQMLVS